MNAYRSIPLVPADIAWVSSPPAATITGLALELGFLDDALAAHGLSIRVLRDEPNPAFQDQVYYHDLKHLFREGGNCAALASRSEGHGGMVVGISWIDEAQLLLARPGSDILSLAGRRLGVSQAGTRWDSGRAMALKGYDTALRSSGLELSDVQLVDVATGGWTAVAGSWLQAAANALLSGRVDVIYAKGVEAVALQKAHGLDVVLDISRLPELKDRINNGTPRLITVHPHLLNDRPELIVRFLSALHKAGIWARSHPDQVIEIIARQNRADIEDVRQTYGPLVHETFDVTLDDVRIAAVQSQADFLYKHRLIKNPVDVASWIDPHPLRLAQNTTAVV